jgi:hypothetical protein
MRGVDVMGRVAHDQDLPWVERLADQHTRALDCAARQLGPVRGVGPVAAEGEVVAEVRPGELDMRGRLHAAGRDP